eukprot:1006223_1
MIYITYTNVIMRTTCTKCHMKSITNTAVYKPITMRILISNLVHTRKTRIWVHESGHHKGGSSMNITKRISEHDRQNSGKQIVRIACILYEVSRHKEVIFTHEQKEEDTHFVPPPPPSLGPYDKSNQWLMLNQMTQTTAVWSPRFVGTFWANLPEN